MKALRFEISASARPRAPRGWAPKLAQVALAGLLAVSSGTALAAHSSDVGYAKGYTPSAGSETRFGLVTTRFSGRSVIGLLPKRDSPESLVGYAGATGRIDWRPVWWRNVDVKLGLRADGHFEGGGSAYREAKLDYDEFFVRARFGDARVTLGAQHVIWGRVDEIPPTDRLSTHDATRYALDQLPDRRRAVPALRFEYNKDELSFDSFLVPFFRPAELPDRRSIWFPVDQRRGRILGARLDPGLRQMMRFASVGESEDFEQFGGFGIRLGRTAEEIDYAFTVQRARHSLPHYEIDPAVLAALQAGFPLPAALAAGNGPTLREIHPLTWALGADFALDVFVLDLDWTIRFEGAYLSDVPVTTVDGLVRKVGGLEWVAALEFYPGDSDTRVNLQLAHRELMTGRDIISEPRTLNLNGEVDYPFDNGRWRWTTRFAIGLNYSDVMLHSEIRYIGREPHEVFLGGYVFAGSEASANGYYSPYDQIVAGWRARF